MRSTSYSSEYMRLDNAILMSNLVQSCQWQLYQQHSLTNCPILSPLVMGQSQWRELERGLSFVILCVSICITKEKEGFHDVEPIIAVHHMQGSFIVLVSCVDVCTTIH